MIRLARHGETTWNVAGRYQGRMESDLTERGEAQARALADAISAAVSGGEPAPAYVVSSPLRRCTQTAAPAAGRLGLDVRTDERLIEIGHGTWEGRHRDELAANDAERYRTWREDPAVVSFEGGESLREVLERWNAFAADLVRDGRPALVVTHDAVVRCALVAVLGLPLDDFWKVDVRNGGFALLAIDGGTLRVVRECVTEHLAGIEADPARQAL